MSPEALCAFEPVEVELLGFDISGFSRFAEICLVNTDASRVDELALLWETAVAPQIDRLIASGYRIADVCGDGVIAWREGPRDARDAERLLGSLEAAFGAVAPGLSLRTSRAFGPLVFAEADGATSHHRWASGEGVQQLHASLAAKRRVTQAIPIARFHAPGVRDEALARSWDSSGAELRAMATMFVRQIAEPWIWTDRARVGEFVRGADMAAAAHGGRLAKVTHDDKGLLLRCEFVGFDRDERLAAVEAGRYILASARAPDELSIAVDSGLVYRGPVRVGARQELTIHGTSVNRAAKATNGSSGLAVFAPADGSLAAQLAAAGLVRDSGRELWRMAACDALPAKSSIGTQKPAFVGREEARAALHAAMSGDAAATIVIEGEAGIGKTALVRRFVAELGPGACVAWCGARPNTGIRDPWPSFFHSLLRQGFSDAAAARTELAAAFAQAGLLADEFGVLHAVGLDLFAPSPSLALLEPFALRDRVDRAFAAVIGTVTARPGTVLVFEDIHWLSGDGWRWVAIARRVARHGLFVLTTRPGQRGSDRPAEMAVMATLPRLVLGPLTKPEALALVCHVRPDLGAESIGQTIAALCAGSPLLIEQMSRAWPAAGAPDFQDFDREIAASGTGDAPVILDRVLDLRLDALHAKETHVLRVLAVEGRPMRPDRIDATADHERSRGVPPIVQRLIGIGLLEAGPDGDEVGLRHNMVLGAVLRRTPSLLLRSLHVRAARHQARAAVCDAAAVAAHWRAGRVPGRAALWFARAAREAERSAQLHAAVNFYDAALAALPQTSRDGPSSVSWRARLSAAAFGVGDLRRAIDEAAGATAGRRAGATPRLADAQRRALLVQSEVATFTADLPQAVSALARLRRLKGDRAEGLAGREAAFWAYVAAILRAGPLARLMLQRAGARSERDRYYTAASLGLIETCFGRWSQAERALNEAIALAPSERFPHENEIAATLLALGFYLRGAFDRSLALFEGILSSGARRENAMHEAWGLYGSAQAKIALGDCSAAADRLTRAEGLLAGHPDRQSRLICTGLRVEIARRSGDRAALLAVMDENLAMSASMPASNFGSFEGYAATPLAALELLCSGVLKEPERNAYARRADRGLRALRQYALIFPIGRPRLALCRGLQAQANGQKRAAISRVSAGLRLAQRLGMTAEAARLEHALKHFSPQIGGST